MRFLEPFRLLLMFLAVDVLALWAVRRGKGEAVLIVAHGGMGDYLLLRNFFETVRRHPSFAGKKIVLCAPIGLRELGETFDRETVDAFIWIDPRAFVRDPRYRFGILKRVKELGCGTALAPRYSREFIWDDALIRASGAPERIGREASPIHRPGLAGRSSYRPSFLARWGKRFYTRILPEDHAPGFEFLRNASFFRAVLGEEALPVSPRLVPVPVALPELPGRFALFFPGAGHPDRAWPVDSFAALARALSREHGLEIVLAGVSDDRERAARIVAAAPGVSFCNGVGKWSVAQLAAVTAQAALVVGGDSGGIHLAAAVGVPGVGLSKGSFLGRFHPYPAAVNPRIHFVYPPAVEENPAAFLGREEFHGWGSLFSIGDVSPEAVLAAANKLL